MLINITVQFISNAKRLGSMVTLEQPLNNSWWYHECVVVGEVDGRWTDDGWRGRWIDKWVGRRVDGKSLYYIGKHTLFSEDSVLKEAIMSWYLALRILLMWLSTQTCQLHIGIHFSLNHIFQPFFLSTPSLSDTYFSLTAKITDKKITSAFPPQCWPLPWPFVFSVAVCPVCSSGAKYDFNLNMPTWVLTPCLFHLNLCLSSKV